MVWEPVLETDSGPPVPRLRLHDDRAIQFWDSERIVSTDLVRTVNADPARYGLDAEFPPDFVVWDVAAVFPRSAR